MFLGIGLCRQLSGARSAGVSLLKKNRFGYSVRNKHYLLQYNYVENVLEKRDPFRPGHLEQILRLNKEGKVVMAGAHANPVDGALIIFDCDSEQEVESFVANDPYHQNGLVTDYTIREWTVVTE